MTVRLGERHVCMWKRSSRGKKGPWLVKEAVGSESIVVYGTDAVLFSFCKKFG